MEAETAVVKVDQFVVPGDIVGRILTDVKLGPGLLQDNSNLIATKAGVVQHRPPNKYWIENSQKRYIPALEEMIIGVVLERHQEGFKLDIGSSHPAALNWTGFELSSRKNRPQWPVGSMVYCRVILANRDMEPEVACVAANGKTQGFGQLEGGIMIKCSINQCRSLLSSDCSVLKHLGKRIPYEIAVGMNGKVWINSQSVKHTVLVANTIQRAEFLSEEQTAELVKQMIEAAR